MDLKTISEIPPWDWPKGVSAHLLGVLRNAGASESDRLLAVELAGDTRAINDDLAGEMLAILHSSAEPGTLRAQAAIALGPVLEEADLDGFEDPEDVPISEEMFHKIRAALRQVYMDAGTPREVLRRCLEAAVRAPDDWQQDAVRDAYASGDDAWKLTAVFCMRFVRGFETQIVESLDSKTSDIYYEAICAAGEWEVDAAWPHVVSLVTSARTEKQLLLAAIDAAVGIRSEEAPELLSDLLDHRDEDIVEAVHEALAMAEGFAEFEDEEDDGETVH